MYNDGEGSNTGAETPKNEPKYKAVEYLYADARFVGSPGIVVEVVLPTTLKGGQALECILAMARKAGVSREVVRRYYGGAIELDGKPLGSEDAVEDVENLRDACEITVREGQKVAVKEGSKITIKIARKGG